LCRCGGCPNSDPYFFPATERAARSFSTNLALVKNFPFSNFKSGPGPVPLNTKKLRIASVEQSILCVASR